MHHTAAHPYHLGKRCIASRATSSAQDCSDDILRLHQQPLYLREYINDHLSARSLRSTNKMQLTTCYNKNRNCCSCFSRCSPKNMEQHTRHSQNSHDHKPVQPPEDTCLAMPLDDDIRRLCIVVLSVDELLRRKQVASQLH